MQTGKKKQIIFMTTAVLLTAVMTTVGTVLAVRTKTTEKRANNFTFGNIRIRLEEEHWDEEEEHIIYPGKITAKDPKIVNTGKNDLYAYLEVRIPHRYVKYTVPDNENGGSVIADSPEWIDIVSCDEPFGDNWICIGDSEGWYEAADGTEITLEQIEALGADAELYHVYRYAYTEVLPAESQTTELFWSITCSPDILEGELADTELEMPVTAYAIQSNYLDNLEGSLQEKLEKAFEQYLKDADI